MKFLAGFATAIAVATIITSGASAADIEAGKTAFRKCMACHDIGEGAKNKVGPELNGLNGRVAGKLEGYKFSNAMIESGITWSHDQFAEYITKPSKKVPKTKMAFAGISKESEIENLWAYLAQFDASGAIKAK